MGDKHNAITAPLNLAAVSMLLITACSLAHTTAAPTVQPASTSAVTGHSPDPTDPPDSIAGDTAPISCPVPLDNPVEFTSTDPLTAGEPLLKYFNTGGSLDELSDQLTAEAMVPAAGEGIVEIAVNPDNLFDLIILLVQPDSANLHPSGRLYIFLCEEDHYTTAFTSIVEDFRFNPQIHTILDMNGDTLPEIVFSDSNCGAHTCFADTQILSWKDEAITNLLSGSTEDLPFPVFDILEMENFISLAVTATAMGSAGAGPFQPYMRTWDWNRDSGLFEPGSDVLLPSSYRIHAFYAAEDLLHEGMIPEALAAYERVIQDDSLSDWAEPARERAVLSSFSQFRMIQADILTDDRDRAHTAYAALQDLSPDDAGWGFSEAARLYWETLAETADAAEACTEAETYTVEHRSGTLDMLYFGYANRVYEPEDICLHSLPPASSQ